MHQNVAERHFFHVFEAREDHSRHPEKDDVVAAGQHVRRVKIFEVFTLFGIAQRGKRPQRRGEPGVQNVLVLF